MNTKSLALLLLVLMALVFIGCGGALAGVAGGNVDGNIGYNTDQG